MPNEGGTRTGQSNVYLHPGTVGMTHAMRVAVTRLIAASRGRVWIVSGFRTYDQQSALYQKYLNGTGNLAAKPGTSRHESGVAVDFGGDKAWIKANAGRFGLFNSVPSENWHYSLIGASETGHGGGLSPLQTAYAAAAAINKGEVSLGGGGGGGGVNVVTPGVADPGPPRLASNATEAQIVKFITDNYGVLAVALLKEPELRKALIDAARAGAEGVRFEEYIHRTGWWRNRNAAQRQWDMLGLQDPNEQKDRINKRVAALKPVWEQYGLDGDIKYVAVAMERLGLNEAQLQASIADQLSKESAQRGLDVGTEGATSADALMKIARTEYLTPIDRQTAERWVIKGIRTGTDIEESFRAYLAGVAAPRFGLDPMAGVAPADVLSPIKATVAENLELNPEAIDLLDPAYAALLQVETEKGGFRPMTTAEATKWARSQEQFKGTRVAEEATTNLIEALGKAFGKVG